MKGSTGKGNMKSGRKKWGNEMYDRLIDEFMPSGDMRAYLKKADLDSGDMHAEVELK